MLSFSFGLSAMGGWPRVWASNVALGAAWVGVWSQTGFWLGARGRTEPSAVARDPCPAGQQLAAWSIAAAEVDFVAQLS